MDVLSVIKKRRSVRNYKPDKIPDEIMEKLLEAVRLAPSGGNRQPYRFIIVQDKDTKSKLAIGPQKLHSDTIPASNLQGMTNGQNQRS